MARVNLSAAKPTMTGQAVTYAAAPADGDAVRPHTTLLVKNGSGSPITVTLVTGGTASGYAVADPTVSVGAGAEVAIGDFSDPIFRQTSGATKGLIHVDYSSVTSVTRLAVS